MIDLAHEIVARWGASPASKCSCDAYDTRHVRNHRNLGFDRVSLWTPGGEHTPEPERAKRSGGDEPSLDDLSPEEREQFEAMQAEMEQVREQLLAAPASVVVANHAMGIYELAAIHLTAPEPKLDEASLAIDALAALVEGLSGRLGDAEPTLRGALEQLRTAYLEVRSRTAGGAPTAPRSDDAAPEA